MITPHPTLASPPPAPLRPPVRVLRNSRMTVVAVACVFVLQLLGGLQVRHGWPVAVYDIGAVAALGMCGTVAAYLYRG